MKYSTDNAPYCHIEAHDTSEPTLSYFNLEFDRKDYRVTKANTYIRHLFEKYISVARSKNPKVFHSYFYPSLLPSSRRI